MESMRHSYLGRASGVPSFEVSRRYQAPSGLLGRLRNRRRGAAQPGARGVVAALGHQGEPLQQTIWNQATQTALAPAPAPTRFMRRSSRRCPSAASHAPQFPAVLQGAQAVVVQVADSALTRGWPYTSSCQARATGPSRNGTDSSTGHSPGGLGVMAGDEHQPQEVVAESASRTPCPVGGCTSAARRPRGTGREAARTMCSRASRGAACTSAITSCNWSRKPKRPARLVEARAAPQRTIPSDRAASRLSRQSGPAMRPHLHSPSSSSQRPVHRRSAEAPVADRYSTRSSAVPRRVGRLAQQADHLHGLSRRHIDTHL